MDFQPIKTKKIYQEIIAQIKGMIKTGSLKPGDRLMPERELAEKLGVGRSAVREAFRVMEAMGIIVINPGEGTFINEKSYESLVNAFSSLDMVNDEGTRELMELRKILEAQSAEMAAERCTADQLKVIGDALEQMQQDIKEGNLGEEADMKFHYAIAEAAGNSLLLNLMNSISDTMKRVLAAARHQLYQDPVNPPRLLEEHRVIYEKIKNNDAVGARQAMLEHLVGVEDYIFNYQKRKA